MDEDIHGLVVIRGVKHKLLPKIKKSSLTHFDSVFRLKKTLTDINFLYYFKFLLSENKTWGYSEQYRSAHSASALRSAYPSYTVSLDIHNLY